MRAFYDTEHALFHCPPVLASIGIVREDGAELYLVSSEIKRRDGGPWFAKNIWPSLAESPKHLLTEISEAVQEFLIPVNEIITRNGPIDLILLEQLVGPVWFKHTDVEPIWLNRGRPKLPKRKNKHHALADAHYYRTIYLSLAP